MDDDFTGASDVYAYGVIIWECLTEKVPWLGSTASQIALKVAQGQRPFPVPKAADVEPPELVSLMTRCWAQAPEARPTFKEVVRTLTKLKAANGGGLRVRKRDWSPADSPPRSPKVA